MVIARPGSAQGQQVNMDSETLCDLDCDPHVRIGGYEGGIADGLITSKVDEVSYQKGVDLFLLADAVDRTESELHVLHVGERQMIDGRPVACTVVPIDAKQLNAIALLQSQEPYLPNKLSFVQLELGTIGIFSEE